MDHYGRYVSKVFTDLVTYSIHYQEIKLSCARHCSRPTQGYSGEEVEKNFDLL